MSNLELDTLPFISVIIPTRNEEEFVGKLMDSLVKQTYPMDKFEILLFDGISEDSTLKNVKEYNKKLNLKIFKNPKIKQVYAWNMGIKKAEGDYFIIFGAHSYLDPYFIENSIKTYIKVKNDETELAAVGGSLETVYKNLFAQLIKLLYSSPFAGVSSFWSKEEEGFKKTVVFALYNKKIVFNVGMFDEDFIIGDDYELNLRLNKNGYKLYSNPNIKAYYFTRSSLTGFLKQSFQYGAVKGLCIRTGYNHLIWWIPLIFLLFEIILILTGINLFSNLLFTVMFILLIIYFLFSIIFSIIVYIKNKDPLAFTLIIMQFIFHNVVALGFLKGLIWGRRTFH